MKKLVLIIGALLLALFAALALYVRSEAFSARIRPAVVSRLQAALGPAVVVGNVKAGLLPPHLEVRDIAVPDDRGTYALAVRKVRFYLNPLPLLVKRISLPAVSVLEPRLSLERSESGEMNVAPLLGRLQPALRPAPGAAAPAFSVRLHALTIRNGMVSFIDRKAGSRYAITALAGRLHGDVTAGKFNLSVRNAEVMIKSAAVPELRFNLKTVCRYSGKKLALDSFTLSARDAWLTASGIADNFPDGSLDLRIKSRISLAALSKAAEAAVTTPGKPQTRVDIEAEVRGTVTAPVIEGSLKSNEAVFRGMTLTDAGVAFAFKDGGLTLEGARWKLAKGNKSFVIDGIRAALQYRGAGLDIRELAVQGGDVTARMTGRIDFEKGYDAVVTFESSEKGRALSLFVPVPLDGRIGVSGRLSGPLIGPHFDGALSAGPLAVRGVPFTSVQGALAYGDGKLSLSDTEIRQQTSRYLFDGSVDFKGKDARFDARLDVIRSDVTSIVSLFYKPLPLQLSAKGELSFTGTVNDYSGSAFLSLDAGTAYGESFDSGTIKASLSTGKISFPQVVLYKGSGVVKGTGWIGFNGSYSAAVQSRFVNFSEVDLTRKVPVSGPFRLDIESSGTFGAPAVVHASLDADDLFYNNVSIGKTSLMAELSDRILSFKGAIGGTKAGLEGKLALYGAYDWSAGFSVHADHIDPFVALGKQDFTARVLIAADGTVTATGHGFDYARISAAAAFPRLRLSIGDYRIENEQPAGFIIDGGRLRITSLKFTGPATRLSLSGETRLKKDMDFVLNGSANLSLLRLLYKEVELAEGPVELKLAASEGWGNPDLSGELTIRNGSLKIRDIPQKFSGLAGRVAFSEGRLLVDSLTGDMGGGKVDLSGWLQLAGFALRDFSFKALGTGITVRYPEGVTSTLSGELFYEGTPAEQTLSGDLAIKQARYEKRVEWKTMLVEMARGLYQKKKTDIGWIGDTQLNIRFHGKEGILLQNNLAKIPLDADVQLRGTINRLQLVGRLEARTGVVYFRKNEFKILHASADFIDPTRLDPVLDIQAETRVREYLIRLAVTGPADRAVITFMSEPPLTDADILGVLALGKTGSELKGKGTGVGMGEAVSFATGQFQDIFEQRARSLTGLDRFQVDPYVSKGDTSVPRVTVGKEIIRDKLYVTYSSNVGASSPEPILKVEYILNRNLSLVGGQNELGKMGADLKFRFEFK